MPAESAPVFTQLSGRLTDHGRAQPLYEPLGANPAGFATFRRRTDGMVCVRIPSADVTLGANRNGPFADAGPVHRASIDTFLIDAEPVSATAYSRFLNSIGEVPDETLREWFVLSHDDKRREHEIVFRHSSGEWRPVAGAERWPMILVSWFGASAYSLWANGQDWRTYRDGRSSRLPSEAQWEYAARGREPKRFPWGDDETPARMRYAFHERGQRYRVDELPLAPVNADLGLSPFGLRHMAGNVWQWCRDWYSPQFYSDPAARAADPVNHVPSGVRSERGGSWIGPAYLCESSYRRGRSPAARGRCLGFRCATSP